MFQKFLNLWLSSKMFQKFPVSELFPVIFKDVSEVSSLSDVSSNLLECSRSSFVSLGYLLGCPKSSQSLKCPSNFDGMRERSKMYRVQLGGSSLCSSPRIEIARLQKKVSCKGRSPVLIYTSCQGAASEEKCLEEKRNICGSFL
jgi:hypothetical protein